MSAGQMQLSNISCREYSEFEDNVHKSALLPTLHVLFHSPLAKTIVRRVYPSESYHHAVLDDLLTWVADEALGGDKHAAEWALLSCISSV